MVGPEGGPSVLAQMATQFRQLQQSVLAVQEVPLEQTRRYGIVAAEAVSPGLMKVQKIVENRRQTWRRPAWVWPGATS